MSEEFNKILYDYHADADGRLKIVKTQDCETILKTIHHIPDMTSMSKLVKSNQRYLATIPNVIGLQWANEAGVRIFSREWTQVVRRKLKDPEFSKLKIQYPKTAMRRVR